MPDRLWCNGALTASAEVRIDPADRGFLLGDGVFETIRADGSGRPLHLARHLARLRQGAAILRFDIPYEDAALADALSAVAAGRECALRLTVTRGPAPRGVLPPSQPRPTVLIASGPVPPQAAAARLVVARETCRNEFSPLSRIKSLNYADAILARLEAQARGADDAILLNTRGRVAESTSSTLLLCRAGSWRTPPVPEGALPGIARALLLAAGLCGEAPCHAQDLARCEAALLVNSLGARIVASIGDRPLDSAPASRLAALAASQGLLHWRPGPGCG